MPLQLLLLAALLFLDVGTNQCRQLPHSDQDGPEVILDWALLAAAPCTPHTWAPTVASPVDADGQVARWATDVPRAVVVEAVVAGLGSRFRWGFNPIHDLREVHSD